MLYVCIRKCFKAVRFPIFEFLPIREYFFMPGDSSLWNAYNPVFLPKWKVCGDMDIWKTEEIDSLEWYKVVFFRRVHFSGAPFWNAQKQKVFQKNVVDEKSFLSF